MTLPRLVLPSQAMPWGRAIADSAAATARAIRAQADDSTSVGRQFAARADSMSRSIRQITNTADISVVPLPDWSGTIGFSAGTQIIQSAEYSISPPSQDVTECRLIINFDADKTAGSGSVATAVPTMRVNGHIFSALVQVNRQPPNVFDFVFGSLSGLIPLSPGQAVTFRYGVRMGPTAGVTTLFHNATAWLVFYRSIQ